MSDSACFPRELVRFWCLERVKTKLAQNAKTAVGTQRRFSSFPFRIADLRGLALRIFSQCVRQSGVRVNGLGKSGSDVAFALVEECRSAKPVL